MKYSEFLVIIGAVIILTVSAGLSHALSGEFIGIAKVLLFSAIIIFLTVSAKKLMAFLLDAGAEHRLWTLSRFGFKPNKHFKREAPLGIILPVLLSVITLGIVKFGGILTYETSALKYRAAKRFGGFSFTEITDWHNGLIGAAGVVCTLLISLVSYFPGFEELSKLAAFYAFSNMIPLSKLDGTQILFGSKVLYIILAVITLIFLGYAIIL